MLKSNIEWLKNHAHQDPDDDNFWLCNKTKSDIKIRTYTVFVAGLPDESGLPRCEHTLLFATCEDCQQPEIIPRDYDSLNYSDLQKAQVTE